MSLMHLKKTGKLKQKPHKNGKLQKNSLQKNYWANRNDLTARRTGIAFVCINALVRYQTHYNMTKRPQHFWLRSLLINSVKNNARRFGGLFLWFDQRRRHSTKGDDIRQKRKRKAAGQGRIASDILGQQKTMRDKKANPRHAARGGGCFFGWQGSCLRAPGNQSISTSSSISQATPPGRALVPMALRAGTPFSSPNSALKRLEAPLMTAGWKAN